jgi:outer membrane protein TolC
VDDPAKEYQALNIDKLTDKLNNNQPVLKALEKSIAANEFTVREKKAEYFPEISAFSTWNHKGSDDEYDVSNNSLYDYGVAGLKVSVPIWEGGKRKEDLDQARIDKKNAELNLRKMSKDLLLELDTAVGEYNEFIKTLEANKEAVRLAEETFKLSQDFFRSGQISITDLNDGELFLTGEKINQEKTLFNINATLAKIEKLTVTEAVSE